MACKFNIIAWIILFSFQNAFANDEEVKLFENVFSYLGDSNWKMSKKELLEYKGKESDSYILWGIWYGGQKNPEHNKILSVNFLEKAVANGDMDAQAMLITLYTSKKHIEYVNFERGIQLAREIIPKYSEIIKAGRDTNGEKNKFLGKLYLSGIGVEKNVVTALNYYKAAAKLGNEKAKKAVVRVNAYIKTLEKLKN